MNSILPGNRSRLAWIAILVMLVHALAPSLVRAAAVRGVLVEICTASGIQAVELPGEPPGNVADLGAHCMFCLVADAPALPSGQPGFFVPAVASSAPAAAPAEGPLPPAPAPVLARGPPAA